MKSIETQAKTVDQAIELGLYKLGTTRDQVKITIIEEAGLFNKARVKLSLNDSSESEQQIKAFIDELLEKCNLNVDTTVEEQEDKFVVDILGKDAAVLIGRHGESLDAFQYLINTICNKDKTRENNKKIELNSNNYRSKRENALVLLAERTAAKAVRENSDIRLEAMNANERRIIHAALSEHNKVTTESQGKEPNRYIVVKLKSKAESSKNNSKQSRTDID